MLRSPPEGADVAALLLNKPAEGGVLSFLFDAAPRKLKSFAAGVLAALFCETPKAGVGVDCAPNGKLLVGAGAEAPKLGAVAPKSSSGWRLKGDAEPALLPPKLEAGGKDEFVDCANGLLGVDDCAGGKLLVELLPKAKSPAPDGVSCCDCPNMLPPGVLCCCAKGFDAAPAPALGSGPKLKVFAAGGLGLNAERPCAQMSAMVKARGLSCCRERVLLDAVDAG